MWTAWGCARVGVHIVFPLSRPAACCCLLVEGKALLISDDTRNVAIHYLESNPTHGKARHSHKHYSSTCCSLLRYWHTLPYRAKASLCPCSSSTTTLTILRTFPESILELMPRIFQDFLFFTTRHGQASRVQTPVRRAVIMTGYSQCFQFLLANSGKAT